MRALLLAALAALVACPAAAAHGGGGKASGYSSTVVSVEPQHLGLYAEIIDGDDQLSLTNDTGKTLVVLGYEGEPYLRVSPDGIYRNVNSPATYLNEDRYGNTPLPSNADPKAPPDWVQLASSGETWRWHDHRIHWMSTVPPPAVRDAPDVRQHIFDWQVPLVLDGQTVTIRGSLDYAPPAGGGTGWLVWLAPIGAVALGGLAWVALRLRRKEPTPA